MKLLSILLILLGLTGCATVSQYVPSLQYCDNIKYERTGSSAHIEADCYVPR
jgi:hypothetical protein